MHMPYSDKNAGWNTSVCNKEVAISNTKRNLPQDGNRTSWKSSIGLEDIMALFLRASSLKQIPNESKKHDVLCANFLAVRHTQDRLGERPAILSHGGYAIACGGLPALLEDLAGSEKCSEWRHA
jgi:hypothetical protein